MKNIVRVFCPWLDADMVRTIMGLYAKLEDQPHSNPAPS